MLSRFKRLTLLFAVVLSPAYVPGASAGTFFTITHFVFPKDWTVGIEPVATLTNGAGIAANLRFTYGLSELNNASLILGIGSGPRQFRVGGDFTFDIFPDIEGQPGVGLLLEPLFVVVPAGWQIELPVAPYIHKAFRTGSAEIEPFLGIPIGLALTSAGLYRVMSSVSFGAMFKNTKHWRYLLEVGIGIAATESTVSGGLAYYY